MKIKVKSIKNKILPNGITVSLKYWTLGSNPTEYAFCQMSQQAASPTVRKKVHNDKSSYEKITIECEFPNSIREREPWLLHFTD